MKRLDAHAKKNPQTAQALLHITLGLPRTFKNHRKVTSNYYPRLGPSPTYIKKWGKARHFFANPDPA